MREIVWSRRVIPTSGLHTEGGALGSPPTISICTNEYHHKKYFIKMNHYILKKMIISHYSSILRFFSPLPRKKSCMQPCYLSSLYTDCDILTTLGRSCFPVSSAPITTATHSTVARGIRRTQLGNLSGRYFTMATVASHKGQIPVKSLTYMWSC